MIFFLHFWRDFSIFDFTVSNFDSGPQPFMWYNATSLADHRRLTTLPLFCCRARTAAPVEPSPGLDLLDRRPGRRPGRRSAPGSSAWLGFSILGAVDVSAPAFAAADFSVVASATAAFSILGAEASLCWFFWLISIMILSKNSWSSLSSDLTQGRNSLHTFTIKGKKLQQKLWNSEGFYEFWVFCIPFNWNSWFAYHIISRELRAWFNMLDLYF